MSFSAKFARHDSQSRLASVIAHLRARPDATYRDLMQTFGMASSTALYYAREARSRIEASRQSPTAVQVVRGPDRRTGERRTAERRKAPPGTPAPLYQYQTPVFLNL